MLIAAIIAVLLLLNGMRLLNTYNIRGLTGFIGRKDWFFDDSPIETSDGNTNGVTVWSLFFLPIAVKPFCHSTAMFD